MNNRFGNRRTLSTFAVPTLLALAATAGCAGGTDGKQGAQHLTNAEIPEFSWAVAATPSNMDFAKFPGINPITPLVMEPLERLSSKVVYQPLLASSVDQPNPKTLVYTIRSGVKFSDGRPLTAVDVAWNIEHYAAKSAGTAGQMPAIRDVSASTGKVTVRLASPDPIARAKIATNVYVMQKRFAEQHKEKLGTKSAVPVGTGPYRLTRYDADELSLERKTDYWGTPPKVKKLDFPVVKDENALRLALRSGEVDGGDIKNLLGLDQWRQEKQASVYLSPDNFVDFLKIDTRKAPFNDLHVRRAIAYATDRTGMAKVGYAGNVSRLKGMVPSAQLSKVAGSEHAAEKYLANLPQYEYSVSKAKAELAKSKYPTGFSTVYEYNASSTVGKKNALVLQRNLKQIGIELELKSITPQEWFSKLMSGKLAPLGISGFNATANDPSGLLTTLVGDNISNVAFYSTPTVRSAVAVVDSAENEPQKRWAATKTILSAVATDVPYVPLYTEPSVTVTGRGFAFAKKTGIDLYDVASGNWIYQLRTIK